MYTRKHQISSHCATFMLVSLIAGTTAIAGDACVMGTNDAPSVGRKSVVLTSKDIDFSKVDFSLGHTLGRLIETASPDAANRITDSPGERAALLQSLLRSLQKSSFINPNGNTTVPVQPRPTSPLPSCSIPIPKRACILSRCSTASIWRPSISRIAASIASSTCLATGLPEHIG